MTSKTTLISTYGRSLLSLADPSTPQIQYILGLGDGSDGWSPAAPFMLTKCYMDGHTFNPFFNATNAREHQFIVWKNGANNGTGAHAAAATTGTRLYKLAQPVDTANEEYTLEDTTQHLILPTDYVTAAVGHDLEDNTGTGAQRSGTLDFGLVLEGYYLTSGGGDIASDGYHTWFHLNGAINSVVKFYMIGQGVSSGSGGAGGYTLDRDVIARRIVQCIRVAGVPVSTPNPPGAVNQIETTLFADGLADPADVILQATRQVTQSTALNTDFVTVATGDTRIPAGSDLYVTLEQRRTTGTGTAQISNVNIWVELEEVVP